MMRASAAPPKETLRRTIDLTAVESRAAFGVPARRTRNVASHDRAVAAYRATRRRRFARGTVDTFADALMALGGTVLANMALKLNLGLPNGIAGIALGIALLGLGAAIAMAHRTVTGSTDPATSMTIPSRVIVLDEPARTVIDLDLPAHHHTAA